MQGESKMGIDVDTRTAGEPTEIDQADQAEQAPEAPPGFREDSPYSLEEQVEFGWVDESYLPSEEPAQAETDGEPADAAVAQDAVAETDDDDDDLSEPSKVQKRIDKLTAQREEERRRVELALKNPTAFRQLYAQEYGIEDAQQPGPQPGPDLEQLRQIDVYAQAWNANDPADQHNGKTLRQIAAEDPAYFSAHVLPAVTVFERNLQEQVRMAERAQEQQAAQTQSQQARAADEFITNLRRTFNDDEKKITAAIEKVKEKRAQAGYENLPYEELFLLTHHQALVKTAQQKGADELVRRATRNQVPSVSSGQAGAKTGYEQDMAGDASSLMKKYDRMTMEERMEWLKNAPQSLRDQYPDFAWIE
jgi:hypothetical protein